MRLSSPDEIVCLAWGSWQTGRHISGAEAPFFSEAERPKAKALGYLKGKSKIFCSGRNFLLWNNREDAIEVRDEGGPLVCGWLV
jgi:hypothetical protein